MRLTKINEMYVYTPRFLRVKITEVFRTEAEAWAAGYTEPTHYGYDGRTRDDITNVLGRSTGLYTMEFAAVMP